MFCFSGFVFSRMHYCIAPSAVFNWIHTISKLKGGGIIIF